MPSRTGFGAHPLDQGPRGVGLEREAEPAGFGDERPRHRPRARRGELVDLAVGASTAALSFARRVGAGDQHQGEVGRQLGQRRDHGVELAGRASARRRRRAGSGATRSATSPASAEQRLVIGRPPALAGLEHLERAAAALDSARARSRARVASILAPSLPAIR